MLRTLTVTHSSLNAEEVCFRCHGKWPICSRGYIDYLTLLSFCLLPWLQGFSTLARDATRLLVVGFFYYLCTGWRILIHNLFEELSPSFMKSLENVNILFSYSVFINLHWLKAKILIRLPIYKYMLNSYFCKVMNLLEKDPKGVAATASLHVKPTDIFCDVFMIN